MNAARLEDRPAPARSLVRWFNWWGQDGRGAVVGRGVLGAGIVVGDRVPAVGEVCPSTLSTHNAV
jgi:hypothetical protein